MNKVLNEELAYLILSIVAEIPEGKVATYGQIAGLIGKEKYSRLVGRVLSNAGSYGDYPCHRVVDHSGRTAPGFDMQKQLLIREGVSFKDADHVDLKKHLWKI